MPKTPATAGGSAAGSTGKGANNRQQQSDEGHKSGLKRCCRGNTSRGRATQGTHRTLKVVLDGAGGRGELDAERNRARGGVNRLRQKCQWQISGG